MRGATRCAGVFALLSIAVVLGAFGASAHVAATPQPPEQAPEQAPGQAPGQAISQAPEQAPQQAPDQLLGPTTTVARAPTPPTTAAPGLPDLLNKLVPPPTAAPPVPKPGTPPTTAAPPRSSAGKAPGAPPGGGDAEGPQPAGPKVIPPGAQALIDAVRRTPPNSNADLIASLRPLIDAGLTEQQAYFLGMGRFPVAGPANFSDDWLYPRFDGGFHFHHGCDVFAAGGTPVRSPANGVLRQSSDTLGGITDYVTQSDGTYFYMAHLSAYVVGQRSGQQVKVGDIIGFVGNTGDAAGGATHVHFEVHPGGGGPVDPKPYLDQWLADAKAAVPALIASIKGTAAVAPAPGLPRRMAGWPSDAFAAPAVPARSSLLWASSASPPGGALLLASAEATEAARSVDWQAEARRKELFQLEWAQGEAAGKASMAPLTPGPLRPLLGFGPVLSQDPTPVKAVTVGPVAGARIPATPATTATTATTVPRRRR